MPLLPPVGIGFVAGPAFICLLVGFACSGSLRSKIRVTALALVFYGLFAVLVIFLPSFANSGGGFANTTAQHPGVVAAGEIFVPWAIMWLLIGIPHRAFRLNLDPDGKGNARRVLARLATFGACALSAGYIVLLHFSGPLERVHLGQLLVGAVFAVALIAPAYRALILAVWRHGVPGFLSWRRLLLEPWKSAIGEARAALVASEDVGAQRREDHEGGATDNLLADVPAPREAPSEA